MSDGISDAYRGRDSVNMQQAWHPNDQQLIDALRDILTAALKDYTDIAVVGSVEIWGRVIECENGFRSQYAYPKELWLLSPGLEYLSWTYGVPVRSI